MNVIDADIEMALRGGGRVGRQERGALPWEWFEIDRLAEEVGGEGMREVGSGGAEQVWKVEVDGREVPFKVLRMAGRGGRGRKWLMMMHGMGLGIGTFRGVARYLLGTHDLILPDYGGFWGRGGGEISLKAFVAAMWRIADALGIKRMSLAGNSMGGGLSLMAAGQRPERIEKVVLANPACYPQELPRMYRMARIPLVGEVIMGTAEPERLVGGVEYIGYVDKTKFDPYLKDMYVRGLRPRRNRLALMEMIRRLPAGPRDLTMAPHLAKLRDIEAPVLVTWGGRDLLLVEGSGERLASDVPGAVFEREGDLAHMPHEEAPERVGPRWAEFLRD